MTPEFEVLLRPLSLKFEDSNLEKAYDEWSFAGARKNFFFALFASSTTTALICLACFKILGRFEWSIFLLGIVCFSSFNVLCGLASRSSFVKSRVQLNYIGVLFLLGCQVWQFAISFKFPELGENYLLLTLMLSIPPSAALTGLNYRFLAPASVFVLLAFVGKLTLWDQVSGGGMMLQLIMSGVLTSIALGTANFLERSSRSEFRIQYGLRSKQEELLSKNKELEQFAYIASHDLQEPLRSITSFSQLLDEDYRDHIGEDGGRYLNYLIEATDRMRRLIKGLLDYSRLGKQANLAKVDVSATMNDILADLRMAVGECHARVEVGPMPVLRAYEVEFRQLLQNLLSNAIKFRRPDVAPVIQISATMKGGYWEFSVKDNGIGIAPEHHSKIFMIFQRLHNRSQYDGTGIGLANCQKIVSMHGGQIWVESDKDQGSTFRFTIPNA